MNVQTSKPLLLALMLIASSLAGCLGNTDEGDDSLGTVMVSTYHVQQLAEAVGGDLVNVQLLSPSNIPVHDYEPTPADVVTLSSADLFLYHGLGLETWVDATLDSMGSSAPKAVSTHAMPDGDIALEFEAILIADLCEHLNEGPYEATNLTAEEEHEEHEEDHHVVVIHYPDNTSVTLENEDADENWSGWNLTYHTLGDNNITLNATLGTWGHMITGIGGVEADASWYWSLYLWNETGDQWDVSQVGIDSVMLNETEHIAWAPSTVNHTMIAEPHHDEEEHEEHDHHEGHEHATAEESIDSPEACPADTMIHIYGLEEGDHVLEFEATGIETFDLVVLKMGGAHAHHHHDHGHDDHGDDDHGEDDHGDDDHGDDDHGDDDHGDDDHGDDDHGDDHGDEGPEILAEHVAHRLSFPEHDDDHDDDHGDEDHGNETHVEHGMITLHIEAEGDYGFALPHDVTIHVLKGEGHEGHDDHDDHGDDDHGDDDHGDDDHGDDDHGDDDHGDDDHGDDDHGDDDHGDEEARFDPHSWLDPLAFRAQVKLVRDAMIEAFPEGEDTFTANAEAYMAELVELDQGFAALSGCTLDEVAANHNAYTYMAERYGLEFVTVHGLDPEGEPSAADIEKVVDKIEDKGIEYFFIEEYTDEDAVASIVEETNGVTVLTLYTMEMAPKNSGDNYLTLMQKNLDNLKSGLGC
ncbi:MAG: zinc ABC transporter substrate-binding protein [Candidatus Thermoplasmatota archaeon]